MEIKLPLIISGCTPIPTTTDPILMTFMGSMVASVEDMASMVGLVEDMGPMVATLEGSMEATKVFRYLMVVSNQFTVNNLNTCNKINMLCPKDNLKFTLPSPSQVATSLWGKAFKNTLLNKLFMFKTYELL